jgi:pyridoxamine-phosphate oxidase
METLSSFHSDPFLQFTRWFNEAAAAQIKNPDAMTLATAKRDGTPSARVVLFKGLNAQGLRFFTNYQSRKAEDILENPKAALVFYWSEQDRQVRVEGHLEKLSSSESDQYWATRPKGSRIGALASPQSTEVLSRKELEERFEQITREYEGKEIPRPEHWGGYCLIPHRFEFWFAGDFRLHDRICYVKENLGWKIIRLAP